MYGLFHLPRLDLRRLYPFDSLRSLRVTAVGRVSSKKVSEEDCHPERRWWRFTDTRSRMGITLVGLYKDCFTCLDLTF